MNRCSRSIGLVLEVIAGDVPEDTTAYLRAIDLQTREFLWSANDAASPPTVTDGAIYYGGTDGTVHGRHRRSGEKIFRLGQYIDWKN